MIPDRWAQVEELFHRATDCEPDQRAQLLEAAGSTDPDLRREVEALLSSRESPNRFPPEVETEAAIPNIVNLAGPKPGAEIGPYHLLQLIGTGGMGEVWLADQKQPVRRRVALKLIKAGTDNREVIARFEYERQALALMDHPAIAKVFDAGSTPQGTPYFVMEYVAGVPITNYCDDQRLNTLKRLELFIKVCDGIQHAHQKAIIHRDVKPSNILVTEVDGRPVPRIIDFGVAKALGQKLTDHTLFTRVGAMVGTPEYMSPEQASSWGEDIDTRTDVYSLGIILYKLLAGAPPLDLRRIPLDEFLRRLREEEPPKPSARIREQDRATSTEVARKRQTEPVALIKQMRGDLDAITLKALEKDRSRRYGSPSELAADIGRHLRHEPVIARPASTVYRVRKYIRRHPTAVIVVGAFTLLSLTYNGIKLEGVRDTLVRENQAVAREVVSGFLNDYGSQGYYPGAAALFSDTLEINRRISGPEHPDTLRSMCDLAEAYKDEGNYAQAETLFGKAVGITRRVLGPEHPLTMACINGLATVYATQGKYVQAEDLFSKTVETSRRVLGRTNPLTLTFVGDFASMYQRQGRFDLAATYAAQALALQRPRSRDADSMESAARLALAYLSEGKFAESEPLAREAFEFGRSNQPDNWQTFRAESLLGASLAGQKRYAEAEPLLLAGYRGMLARKERIDVPDWYYLDRARNWIAGFYESWGKLAKAAEWK